MAIDGDLSMLADFGVKTVDTGAKSPGPGSPSGLSDFASSPDRDASLSPAAGAAAHPNDAFCRRIFGGQVQMAITDCEQALARENMRLARMTAGGGGATTKQKAKKIRPNAKCPCGSGKKYKKCCRNKQQK